MNESECLFCRIVRGEVEAERILENDQFVAIRDRFPKAPVHALVIPRRHIQWLNDIGDTDDDFCHDMLAFIVEVARKLGVADSGYRVVNNVGTGGGQVIFHLHWHLLAGKDVGLSMEDNL
ncbi:MAG: histidine triad nucleotide-binding protein [Thermoleophilia bacterium]